MAMSGPGFYRGISHSQTPFFADKEQKMLKESEWPEHFNKTVDLSKVSLDIVKSWITRNVTQILGHEDDIVIDFIVQQLLQQQDENEANNILDGRDESAAAVDPKKLAVTLSGFMADKAKHFVDELWQLLLSAQESERGIPKEFQELQELERRQKLEEAERIKEELAKLSAGQGLEGAENTSEFRPFHRTSRSPSPRPRRRSRSPPWRRGDGGGWSRSRSSIDAGPGPRDRDGDRSRERERERDRTRDSERPRERERSREPPREEIRDFDRDDFYDGVSRDAGRRSPPPSPPARRRYSPLRPPHRRRRESPPPRRWEDRRGDRSFSPDMPPPSRRRLDDHRESRSRSPLPRGDVEPPAARREGGDAGSRRDSSDNNEAPRRRRSGAESPARRERRRSRERLGTVGSRPREGSESPLPPDVYGERWRDRREDRSPSPWRRRRGPSPRTRDGDYDVPERRRRRRGGRRRSPSRRWEDRRGGDGYGRDRWSESHEFGSSRNLERGGRRYEEEVSRRPHEQAEERDDRLSDHQGREVPRRRGERQGSTYGGERKCYMDDDESQWATLRTDFGGDDESVGGGGGGNAPAAEGEPVSPRLRASGSEERLESNRVEESRERSRSGGKSELILEGDRRRRRSPSGSPRRRTSSEEALRRLALQKMRRIRSPTEAPESPADDRHTRRRSVDDEPAASKPFRRPNNETGGSDEKS